MATVIVSPSKVVRFAHRGGHFWVYMQYVDGLRQLGCDVYWLEHLTKQSDPDERASLAAFLNRMERYGLAGKVLLYQTNNGQREFIGTTSSEAEALFRRADLLLNFDYSVDAGLLSGFRRTALVDIDPGLLQYWVAAGQCRVLRHDLHFTTGETVGRAATPIPDVGVPWIHIRPPVSLRLWPFTHRPQAEVFTTVSSWWGREYIVDSHHFYDNNKRAAFLDFLGLPARTGQALELALCFGKRAEELEERRLLERHGWRVRDTGEVAATPETYQCYVQRSRGEFSCVKPSCIEFQNAWMSDRTLCYLASGKPAVVQNTGPSSFLPSGQGLFRFSTMEEAVDAFAAINADYQRHCRAAREIAETWFDARQVAEGILNTALQTREWVPATARYLGAESAPDSQHETIQLMIESLREGLGALRGRDVWIRELHRDAAIHSNGTRTERLRVRVGSDEWLPMLFKDLNPRREKSAGRTEALMQAAGDAGRQVYAIRCEPARGLYWLFLANTGTGS